MRNVYSPRSLLLPLAGLILLTTVCFLVLLGIGSMRYGGVGELFWRIRVEVKTRINTLRPHTEFVPTPLPMPPLNTDAFADQLIPTPIPSSNSLAVPTPFVAPTSNYQSIQPAVELSGFIHMWQTWNNCGPATLATNLSFYNYLLDQQDVAAVLKPNRDDKNVNPEEMVAYVHSLGLQGRVFVNGDPERLRLLLSNGIPVLIETWLEPEPDDGLGHYRLLTGYDDDAREWIASDSFVGSDISAGQPYRGIRVPYGTMDPLWAVFNRTYIVVYPSGLAPLVQDIIGEDMSQSIMWRNSLQRFQSEIQTQPDDPFAWFNLGSTLVTMGQFDQAAIAYDQARIIGLPWRMLWYQFGPFRTYYEIGRYEELIALAEATIKAGGEIEEIYYWKGRALAAQNDPAGARQAWERALVLKPTYNEASAALASVAGQ